MSTALDERLFRGGNVTVQSVGDGTLLVDMRSGSCFELNRTGAEIWALLASGATIRSICAALAARYQISDDAVAADVRNIIDALRKHHLVGSSPPPEKK